MSTALQTETPGVAGRARGPRVQASGNSESRLTSCLCLSCRRIGPGEVDAHQLAVPHRPVLCRVSWTFSQNQEDCTGKGACPLHQSHRLTAGYRLDVWMIAFSISALTSASFLQVSTLNSVRVGYDVQKSQIHKTSFLTNSKKE